MSPKKTPWVDMRGKGCKRCHRAGRTEALLERSGETRSREKETGRSDKRKDHKISDIHNLVTSCSGVVCYVADGRRKGGRDSKADNTRGLRGQKSAKSDHLGALL